MTNYLGHLLRFIFNLSVPQNLINNRFNGIKLNSTTINGCLKIDDFDSSLSVNIIKQQFNYHFFV